MDMSGTFSADIRNSALRRFGSGAFEFFDRAYFIDWMIASAMWFASWILKGMPPFEREFDRKDPLIDHKHRPNQISGNLTWILAFAIPITATVTLGLFRRSVHEIHHSLLALYSGRGLSQLITEFLKNRVGRLRPDFLHRCKWDKELKACTGELEKVLDGRRSFPSGHSSTAFSGMMFLSLWIASITGAWCFSRSSAGGALLKSKLARLVASLLPLVFATWVAISRVEDYRHHKEDVIVGSLIGIASATICYLIYWPNPFSKEPHLAKMVYGAREDTPTRYPARYGYEMAGMGNEEGDGRV